MSSAVLPRLQDLLAELESDLQVHTRDPLYVIGSAAACLAGAAVDVGDLDVLSSREDAIRLETAWATRRVVEYQPADAQLFRSRFARYRFDAMPVELMGGLEIHRDGAWAPLHVHKSSPLPASRLRLPTISEQRRVLQLFGRPKDMRRIVLLEALARQDSP